MAFPRRLLTEGEELVLDLRPHWIALAGPTIVTILLIVAEAFALTNIPGDGRGHDILFWTTLAAGIALFLAYPVRAAIGWATSHFVVTNERVIHRKGLIAKDSMEIPLERITDVRFHQGVFERVIGAGDLILESAGERGEETFSYVRRPEHVQKTIYEQSEARQSHGTGL